MRISRVHLQGFGAFNQGLDVKFALDRLNLVVGRNEAGKSTLLQAIFGILFGFRDLNLARKYEPWDDHDGYAGELELETDDGRRLLISRDFKENTASVVEVGEGEETLLFSGSADPRGNSDLDQTYFEYLNGLLGFQDETVFRSTVFFGQQSLQTAVSDQVRRLISGSTSADYKGVLHELHRRFSDLTTENPWKGKPRGRRRLLEETLSRLAEDRQRLEEGRQILLRRAELEEDLGHLGQRRDQLEQEILQGEESLREWELVLSLLARREEAERRYQEALGRRDNIRRYAELSSEIEGRLAAEYGAYRQAPEDLPDKIRAYAAERGEMQRETEALAQEMEAREDLRPVPNQAAGLVAGLSLLALSLSGGWLTPLGPLAALVLGLALFPLGFLGGRRLGTGFKQSLALAERRIDDLEASISRRRRRAEQILSEVGPALAGRPPSEVLHEYRGFHELREERKRLQAAVKALGQPEQVEAEFAHAVRERGAVDAALEELVERSPSLRNCQDRSGLGRHLQDLRQQHSARQSELAAIRTALEDCRVELAALGAHQDFNLAELEEGIREQETKASGYDLERCALKEAIDTLDQCVKDFQEGDVFRLSEEISSIFARITGEKYTRVHLGASMDPVISRGDRLPISPEDLSQGTQDQLYFAMRVAMARHLSRNIRLPLFLDDPFVNFDAERLAVTRKVLEHLQDHQIIMVTCDRDYQQWTETLIDLDQARAAGAGGDGGSAAEAAG